MGVLSRIGRNYERNFSLFEDCPYLGLAYQPAVRLCNLSGKYFCREGLCAAVRLCQDVYYAPDLHSKANETVGLRVQISAIQPVQRLASTSCRITDQNHVQNHVQPVLRLVKTHQHVHIMQVQALVISSDIYFLKNLRTGHRVPGTLHH